MVGCGTSPNSLTKKEHPHDSAGGGWPGRHRRGVGGSILERGRGCSGGQSQQRRQCPLAQLLRAGQPRLLLLQLLLLLLLLLPRGSRSLQVSVFIQTFAQQGGRALMAKKKFKQICLICCTVLLQLFHLSEPDEESLCEEVWPRRQGGEGEGG